MKTMKQLITVIAILLSVQVFAASDINIRSNGNAEVIIEAVKTLGDERIRIFDEESTLLFFEIINETKYLKTFSMSTLPNGKYFIEYENENKIMTAVINKTSDDKVVCSDFDQIIFKPTIKQDGNLLSVSLTNPKFNNVNIIITDSDGYELINIKNLDELFVNKIFNTKNLPKGKYALLVKSENQSHSKLITIR